MSAPANVHASFEQGMEIFLTQPDLIPKWLEHELAPVIACVAQIDALLQREWERLRGLNGKARYDALQESVTSRALQGWLQRDTEEPPTLRSVKRSGRDRRNLVMQLGLHPIQRQPVVAPERFIVFGCPDAARASVAVLVDREEDLERTFATDAIAAQMESRPFDTVNAFVDTRHGQWIVCRAQRGAAALLQNNLLSTGRGPFRPPPVAQPLELELDDFVSPVINTAIDLFSVLLPSEEWGEAQKALRTASHDSAARRALVVCILSTVAVAPTHAWQEAASDLTFKILQMAHFNHTGNDLYTRAELLAATPSWLPTDTASLEGLQWLLSRGSTGRPHSDSFRFLSQCLGDALRASSPNVQWSPFPMEVSVEALQRVCRLDPFVLTSFLDNPSTCTDAFRQQFALYHGCDFGDPAAATILFKLSDHRNSPPEAIPECIKPFHVDVRQGGPEWMELQRVFNPRSITPAELQVRDPEGNLLRNSNYLRGLVAEGLAGRAVNQKGFRRLSLGMLLDRSSHLAISPDALLVGDSPETANQAIVYEVKAVCAPPHSKPYARAVWMATRQLRKASKFLESCCGMSVVGKRVILVFIDQRSISAQICNLE